MSWLRLDDGFAGHRKITKLTDRQFRVWVRILCHCARYQAPDVDEGMEIRGLDAAVIGKLETVGLLERHSDRLLVHDWILYTDAPIADKVAYYLTRHPQASSNEVVRALAARRESVLAEVKRFRNGSLEPLPAESPNPSTGSREPSTPVPAEPVPAGSTEPPKVVPSRPVPSRKNKNPSVLPTEAHDAEEGRPDENDPDKINPLAELAAVAHRIDDIRWGDE